MYEFAIAALAILLVTVGPAEVAALFLALTQNMDRPARMRLAVTSSVIAAGVLLLFAFGGNALLQLLGIGLPAFRTAGGILLLKLAADLLLSHHSELSSISSDEEQEAQQRERMAVFPLAIPLIAGPGSITAVLLLKSRSTGLAQDGIIVAAIAAVIVGTFLSMILADRLVKLMGITGSNVVARISGILLAALAMQFVFDGLSQSGIFN